MDNRKNIDKQIDETLESLDGATRAAVKPYLLTRINARMQPDAASGWEKAFRFITRPSVLVTSLCLIIAVNAGAIFYNSSRAAETTAMSDQQVAAVDEFSTTVAKVYDIENTEP